MVQLAVCYCEIRENPFGSLACFEVFDIFKKTKLEQITVDRYEPYRIESL